MAARPTIVQAHRRPFAAVDWLNLVGRDQARDFAIIDHHKAALPSAKQFLFHEVLYGRLAIHRGAIPRHHIRGPHPLEGVHDSDLRITFPRRLQQKPTDESDPQTSDTGATEVPKNSESDKAERDRLSDLGGDFRRAVGISRLLPDDRT